MCYYYLSGSGVDDVDERNVKSQHAKDVGHADKEEDGIFHEGKVHQTGNFFAGRFRYAGTASTGFLTLGGLYSFRDGNDTLAVIVE